MLDYVPDQDKKHQAGLKGWKEPKLLLHQTSQHALGWSISLQKLQNRF